MSLVHPLPPWALALVAGALLAVAYSAYAGRRLPLGRSRRLALGAMRFAVLAAILLAWMRPVRVVPAINPSEAIVPVLVDTSRSMALADVDGRPRLEQAAALVGNRLRPALGQRFQVDLLAFGDRLASVELADLRAEGRRSDIAAALDAVRTRYRGRRIAGVILLTDGAATTETVAALPEGLRVFPVGIGAGRVTRDREVANVMVGQPGLGDSVTELTATVVARGMGTSAVDLRVLQDGKLVDVARVDAPDGAPVRHVFRVTPSTDRASLYTVEVPADPGEVTDENNRQSVLVRPPGRSRRLLIVEGAPGFEHSFLKRALALDEGVAVDSVVRKGRNDEGDDTFLVQAARDRAAALRSGYPANREGLFAYDGVLLANIEGDFFTRTQLEATAAFVAERGGGLLVMGGRSFSGTGLTGSPVEETLPLELTDRVADGRAGGPVVFSNRVALTRDGEAHPVMQLGPTGEASRKRWSELPALATSIPLGTPRPGASVLAVTSGPGGSARPLVAVQPYGRGRSMIFTGEGAWRWRMRLPSGDREYETFWRQVARWLTVASPDPVTLTPPAVEVGEAGAVRVEVRDATFTPVPDATLELTVTDPDGSARTLATALRDPATASYEAVFTPARDGVYRFAARARRGDTPLGEAAIELLVGGQSTELAEPRRHDDLLRRLAESSGGRLFRPDDLDELPGVLSASVTATEMTAREDLWHNPWVLAAILGLLTAEWGLRRRWGLR
jgi:uncharacterized membrane protein